MNWDWPRELQAPLSLEEFPSFHTEMQGQPNGSSLPPLTPSAAQPNADSLVSLPLTGHLTRDSLSDSTVMTPYISKA